MLFLYQRVLGLVSLRGPQFESKLIYDI